MSSPRLGDYLAHIIEAIERISEYTDGMEAQSFLDNTLVQDAVIRNLEIIGEASHRIESRHSDYAAMHPELPVASAYQMRNAVAHGYFAVDLRVVWNTVTNDLPMLESTVRTLLAEQGWA